LTGQELQVFFIIPSGILEIHAEKTGTVAAESPEKHSLQPGRRFLIQTWSQALYTVLTLLPGNTGNGLNVEQDRQQGEF
jgi:hypothetical protein